MKRPKWAWPINLKLAATVRFLGIKCIILAKCKWYCFLSDWGGVSHAEHTSFPDCIQALRRQNSGLGIQVTRMKPQMVFIGRISG